jgi:hypothetical protein
MPAAKTVAREDAALAADHDNTRSGGRGNGRNGPLDRLTVNLTGRASRALDQATEITGDTKTDAVNRALQVYAYLEEVLARGGSLYVREAQGSELERLKVF